MPTQIIFAYTIFNSIIAILSAWFSWQKLTFSSFKLKQNHCFFIATFHLVDCYDTENMIPVCKPTLYVFVFMCYHCEKRCC